MLVWRAYNRPRDSGSCHIWTLEIIHVGLSCMLIFSLSSRWTPPASRPVAVSLVFCVGSSSAHLSSLRVQPSSSCLQHASAPLEETIRNPCFFLMELIFQWGKLDSCVSWRRMLSEDRQELKDLGTALFLSFYFLCVLLIFICFILKL